MDAPTSVRVLGLGSAAPAANLPRSAPRYFLPANSPLKGTFVQTVLEAGRNDHTERSTFRPVALRHNSRRWSVSVPASEQTSQIFMVTGNCRPWTFPVYLRQLQPTSLMAPGSTETRFDGCARRFLMQITSK